MEAATGTMLVLTGSEIMASAFQHCGLEARQGSEDADVYGTYELTGVLLQDLQRRGICSNPYNSDGRPLPPGVTNFVDYGEPRQTLDPTEPRGSRGGSRGCTWTFYEEQPRRIKISATVEIESQGVRLTPRTNGFSFVDEHHLRVFKVLKECGVEMHPFAHRIIDSDEGNVLIAWEELGLGGILTLENTFKSFCQGQAEIEKLIEIGVFFPIPRPPRGTTKVDAPYIPLPAQSELHREWRRQLDDFITRITLP